MTLFPILTGIMESLWEARTQRKNYPKASHPVFPDHQMAAIRNSTWMLASRVASQVFAAALTIIVARGLGEVGLGQYAFIASLLMIANVATTFGTDTYLVREIAARPENTPGAVKAVLVVQLFLSGLVIITCWIAVQVDHISYNISRTILVFSLSLIPLAFYSVYSAVLRAREQMYHYMLITFFYSGLQAIGAWFVIRLGGDLMGLALLTLAAATSSSVLANQLCRRSVPGLFVSRPIPLRAPGKIIRLALPLALLTGLAVIYQRSPLVLLAWLAGEATTGWYSASLRVVEMFKIVHFAVLGGLFPLMARLTFREEALLSDSSGRFRGLSRWSFLLLSAVSLTAALTLRIAAPIVISLAYGSGFGPSVPVLQTQAWILVPYAVTSHQSLVLVVRGQERLVLLATVLALFLLIGLSLAWIPMMGAVGAARASLAAETGLAIILWILRKLRKERQ
jgi:O-antigen/teichoic acid export membrane protein